MDRDDDARPESRRWPLVAMGAVVLLLLLGAALWTFGGGFTDLDEGGAWVAALGSEDGMQRAAIVLVGEATALAGAIYVVALAASRPSEEDRPLMLIALVGAALLTIDGAILVAIGWVATPYMADAGVTPEHPFVKTIELLLFTRSHISFYAGGLIGLAAAWDAWRSFRGQDLPKWAPLAGIAAGALAIIGGALLLIGFGAALRTVGIIGSVAWSGARSALTTYRAATDEP